MKIARSLPLAAALVAAAFQIRAADPVISELLANGSSTLLDEDGAASDWIEVYNPGPTAVSLLDWALTDEKGNLAKWKFPLVVLDPGAYLVVFASGKDRRTPGSELHTSFKLTSQGEYLALVAPGGSRKTSEFAPFPSQHEGFSFGLGRRTLEPKIVAAGAPGRLLVPTSDALGTSWTGGNEPFNDAAQGWLAVASGVGYPGSGGPAPPLPIAYYSLDGDVLDTSGGENHAQIRGNPTFSTDVPAKLGSGKSLSFDGVDDYLSAELDVSETPYSLSLWFKADTVSRGIYTVVDGELGSNGFDRLLFLNGTNISTRVWNNETIVSTGKNFADQKWHHAVHVVGGWTNGQRIYVDGALVASGAKSASDFNWQQRIHIGFANDAGAPYFDGRIDDVSIWDVALTEAQILSLSNGANPLALSGYAPWITTSVESVMRNVNTSAYLRIPFDLTMPLDFNSLLLRVRYDDGFAAYLNGTEVARRNAPAALAFNSQAPTDRPAAQVIRLEDIDLSSSLGLLRNGRNILAVHCLNDRPDSADFLFQPELVKVEGTGNLFLTPPTPGAPNAAGVVDFVEDTAFSVKRGYFTSAFDVAITTPTPGAQVLYTTNGSAPGAANPASKTYTGPIRISRTTVLRAAAFKTDFQPTNVDSQTYIFTADVAVQPAAPAGLPTTWAGGFPADYGVDSRVVSAARPGYSFAQALASIPTLSLAADPDDLFGAARGIYSNSGGRGAAWERAASIELMFPDGSSKGFQADCGIRMHGNSSRDHNFTPKHPIRLLFKGQYGQKKLKYRLFEDSKSDSFDELLLRGCSTDSWPVVDGGPVLGVQRWAAVHATYLRDQFMRDSQIAMGRPSCHGTYVHLFLGGLYWGLYNLAERPVDSFCANSLGGSKDEYDVLKDFAELQDGNADAWNAMISLAGQGLASDAAYQRIQGKNPDGTRNPAYPVYLDVDNLIDYMVLHIASGAEDWPHHNWWAGRRRGPESTGFKFFSWDQEISNDSLIRQFTLFQTRFEDPVSSPSPSYLYGQCMANAGFRRAFGDRVHQHLMNGGLLTPEKSQERWLRRQTEIDQGIVGESARWGDSKKAVPYKREVEWLNEMNFMRDQYWPGIHSIALDRFRRVGLYPAVSAPTFEVNGSPQHGGEIHPGDDLAIAVPVAPRVVEVALLAGDAPASAFVPSNGLLGEEWRERTYVEGAHTETWKHGQNGVGYEASTGYEAAIHIDVKAEMYNVTTTVFVRIPFTIADAAAISSLDGLRLKVLFDDGFAAYLNGTRIADANAPPEGTISWSSASTVAGTEAVLGSPTLFDVSQHLGLLRVGSNLLAIQGLNSTPSSSDMLILAELAGLRNEASVPAGTVFYTLDGTDPTLPAALGYTNPIQLAHTARVKTRARDGGEWSALTEAVFTNPADFPLRVTEVMFHPQAPPIGSPYDEDEFEYVEILNTGIASVSLSGVRLEGGVEFDFADSAVTTLGPGERLLVVENVDAFVSLYDPTGLLIAGEFTGRLANAGEPLVLKGPIGETLLDFRYDGSWFPETNGGGHSLVVTDPNAATSTWSLNTSWKPSVDVDGSPGVPEPGESRGGRQIPGDSNQDGRVDIADAVSLLRRLFDGGLALPCEGAALADGGNRTVFDLNADSAVNLTDAVHLLTYLFRSGSPPAGGTRCVAVDGCADRCAP